MIINRGTCVQFCEASVVIMAHLLVISFCTNTAFEGHLSIPCLIFSVFFYMGFLSRTFTNRRTAGEGGRHFFNFSLSLPPALQALRHQPVDCCKQLTSAHSQQLDSNREPLVSERKSLTTQLSALYSVFLWYGPVLLDASVS